MRISSRLAFIPQCSNWRIIKEHVTASLIASDEKGRIFLGSELRLIESDTNSNDLIGIAKVNWKLVHQASPPSNELANNHV